VWSFFWFRAENDTNEEEKSLVEVHIAEYDVSWDSLLYDETDHEWATKAIQKEIIYEL